MTELPKALSASEREALNETGEGDRALALIDAQAALLAEYAAQAVADGHALEAALSGNAVATKRARSAEARIAELERELDAKHATLVRVADNKRAGEALLTDIRKGSLGRLPAALRTRIVSHLANQTAALSLDDGGEHPSEPTLEALRTLVEHWRDATDAAESKLAAANALLERARGHCPDAVIVRIDAHLTDQPAAPSRECIYRWCRDNRSCLYPDRAKDLGCPQPAAPALDEGPESCMSPYRENYDPNVPTRTEAVFEVQGRSWPAGTYPTRTEAEPRNPHCAFCGNGHEVCVCL